jgi:hypothetical protein
MLPFGASAVAVSYAYFMKSAAQRLGPTLPLSGRQGAWGGEAQSWWWSVHSKGLLGAIYAKANAHQLDAQALASYFK